MKNITQPQIEAILSTIYNTNIPVAQFDAIRKMLNELPECLPEVKDTTPKK